MEDIKELSEYELNDSTRLDYPITQKELSTAIFKVFENSIDKEQADEYATIITDYFGRNSSITDNLLSDEVANQPVLDSSYQKRENNRYLFYKLEALGLIGQFQDEVIIKKNKRWRIHLWEYNISKIKELAYSEEAEIDEYAECYDNLDDVWKDRE